jgi:4-amino-4-deoxy-L-arabinose transferase-like glycosyltransferase
LSTQKKLTLLVTGGFILRLLFFLVGARVYYGNNDFTTNGDTWGWTASILNLINHGIYTADLAVENALYYRPPGFGFFIGIFYYLGGCDMDVALKIIPWVQIIMDTFCIYFIYHIAQSLFENDKTTLISTALYAFYPFIIVWNPIIVAESSSVFFLLASLYFYFGKNKYGYLLSGILLGIAALTRLQTIFIFPFMAIAILIAFKILPWLNKNFIQFCLGFALIYGIWPARNYLLHDRIMFSQDLNVGKNWSPDYLAFMDYIFSIQTDHLPQYDQIVNFEDVTWPKHAYLKADDSLLLAKTIELCRHCGTGFSYFMINEGTVKATVPDSLNCDAEIAKNFKQLTSEQKTNNAYNYYIKVPVSNLYKCFFKLNLYGDKDWKVKLFSLLLFLYRTVLIFGGLIGLNEIFKKDKHLNHLVFLIAGFFLAWYLYLSFVYRNIEIRYLLPVDILLLLPAAWLISFYLKKIKKAPH